MTTRNMFKKTDAPGDAARTPPHNADAEMGVLGAIINEGGGEPLTLCREAKLTPEHFYNAAHQTIYAAILALSAAGKPTDDITLPQHLSDHRELSNIGGVPYLNELSRRAEVSLYVQQWVDIIREHFVRRRILTAASTAIESVFRRTDVASETILEDAAAAFFDLTHSAGEPVEDLATTIGNIRHRFNEAVAGRATEDFLGDRISWGFDCLDKRFKPLCARKGDFLIGVFGPPGHGKSSLIDNVLARALADGKCVVKHSLETSNEATLLSLAALHSGIPMSAADDPAALAAVRDDLKGRRVASVSAEERASGVNFFDKHERAAATAWEQAVKIQNDYLDFLAAIHNKTFFAYDHTQEFTDLVSTTRDASRRAAKHGRKIDLLVVDYLQEIELRQSEKERLRSDEILDRIARQLKKLAKQLKCPAVLIASLNNAGTEGRPAMKHIRGSGGISFILDRAIGVYRPDETKDGAPNRLTDTHHTVEVMVEQFNKRNTPGWMEKMHFHGPTKRFQDISRFTGSSGVSSERIETRGRPKGVKNGEGRAHQTAAPRPAAHDDRPWSEGE